MTNDPFYINSIEGPVTAEFRDRGSRFLAFAFPIRSVEEFKTALNRLKKEHPKAVHHCFAYRLGVEGTEFRVSDDGEPSGTAGRPILGQIDSHQLQNVLVVVVRYFGGTLLGVPGLIHAYKTAAAAALDQAKRVQEAVREQYRLQFDYSRLNDVMRWVKHFQCTVERQEIGLFCTLQIGVPKKDREQVLAKYSDIQGVECVRT